MINGKKKILCKVFQITYHGSAIIDYKRTKLLQI